MDEQDLLRKVQALLKKAEGTDNANEAETFFAKANELMVKYAIDEETVRAEMRRAGKGVEEPVVENFMFSSYAHHAKAKEALFVAVAKSQAVRTFPYGNQKHSNDYLVEAAGLTGLYESQWVRVIGYKSDIEHAKLLYVSLLIQSQKAANADWRERYGDAKKTDDWPQIGKFTWLSSHMDGFSERIAERFRESKEYVMAEANANALMIDKGGQVVHSPASTTAGSSSRRMIPGGLATVTVRRRRSTGRSTASSRTRMGLRLTRGRTRTRTTLGPTSAVTTWPRAEGVRSRTRASRLAVGQPSGPTLALPRWAAALLGSEVGDAQQGSVRGGDHSGPH
jgi:hypothetical protein